MLLLPNSHFSESTLDFRTPVLLPKWKTGFSDFLYIYYSETRHMYLASRCKHSIILKDIFMIFLFLRCKTTFLPIKRLELYMLPKIKLSCIRPIHSRQLQHVRNELFHMNFVERITKRGNRNSSLNVALSEHKQHRIECHGIMVNLVNELF